MSLSVPPRCQLYPGFSPASDYKKIAFRESYDAEVLYMRVDQTRRLWFGCTCGSDHFKAKTLPLHALLSRQTIPKRRIHISISFHGTGRGDGSLFGVCHPPTFLFSFRPQGHLRCLRCRQGVNRSHHPCLATSCRSDSTRRQNEATME